MGAPSLPVTTAAASSSSSYSAETSGLSEYSRRLLSSAQEPNNVTAPSSSSLAEHAVGSEDDPMARAKALLAGFDSASAAADAVANATASILRLQDKYGDNALKPDLQSAVSGRGGGSDGGNGVLRAVADFVGE